MMNKLLTFLGIMSGIFSILAVWFIGPDSPIWVKILITSITAVIGAVIVVFIRDSYNIQVKSYHYREEENEYRVYTKKNKYLVEDSVVSVYYKHKINEETYETLVAVGYVFFNDNANYAQIKIFQMIDEKLMRCIFSSDESRKNFYIKPNVEFARISEIIFEEREAEQNDK